MIIQENPHVFYIFIRPHQEDGIVELIYIRLVPVPRGKRKEVYPALADPYIFGQLVGLQKLVQHLSDIFVIQKIVLLFRVPHPCKIVTNAHGPHAVDEFHKFAILHDEN